MIRCSNSPANIPAARRAGPVPDLETTEAVAVRSMRQTAPLSNPPVKKLLNAGEQMSCGAANGDTHRKTRTAPGSGPLTARGKASRQVETAVAMQHRGAIRRTGLAR